MGLETGVSLRLILLITTYCTAMKVRKSKKKARAYGSGFFTFIVINRTYINYSLPKPQEF